MLLLVLVCYVVQRIADSNPVAVVAGVGVLLNTIAWGVSVVYRVADSNPVVVVAGVGVLLITIASGVSVVDRVADSGSRPVRAVTGNTSSPRVKYSLNAVPLLLLFQHDTSGVGSVADRVAGRSSRPVVVAGGVRGWGVHYLCMPPQVFQ